MNPVCFYLFSWPIYWYGVMFALAFVLAITHWNLLAKRWRYPEGIGSELGLWLIIGGILGARLAYVLGNWPEYVHAPLRALNIREGGLVFYGGWIGGALAFLALQRKTKYPFLDFADFTISAIPLAHAVGRIGCFLNGCCYGAATSLPLAVYMHDQWRHPTQLYEAASNAFIYGLVWYRLTHRRVPGQVLVLYLLTYPAARFLIEFLRGDDRVHIAGLSAAQITSLLLFLCSVGLYLFTRRFRTPEPPEPNP